jgi:hypothetical protein
MGSIAMTEADGYFVNSYCADLSVNIAQSYLSQIDHDLYVAPDGDDTNSGLSAETPLKTIAYAMQRITANPNNPRTLNLAAGVYSHSNNAQLFPFALNPMYAFFVPALRQQSWMVSTIVLFGRLAMLITWRFRV